MRELLETFLFYLWGALAILFSPILLLGLLIYRGTNKSRSTRAKS